MSKRQFNYFHLLLLNSQFNHFQALHFICFYLLNVTWNFSCFHLLLFKWQFNRFQLVRRMIELQLTSLTLQLTLQLLKCINWYFTTISKAKNSHFNLITLFHKLKTLKQFQLQISINKHAHFLQKKHHFILLLGRRLTELCCRHPSGPGCREIRSQPVWTDPPRRDPGLDAPGPAESLGTLGLTDPGPAHSRSPCTTPGGGGDSVQPIDIHWMNRSEWTRNGWVYLHRVGQVRIRVFSCPLKQVLTQLNTETKDHYSDIVTKTKGGCMILHQGVPKSCCGFSKKQHTSGPRGDGKICDSSALTALGFLLHSSGNGYNMKQEEERAQESLDDLSLKLLAGAFVQRHCDYAATFW